MHISIYKQSLLPNFIGSDNSDSVVLFIHGLGGSHNTWRDFSNHLKSEWKEKDSFNLEYDEYYSKSSIFFLRRFINIIKIIKGEDIDILSKHLKTVIEENCESYENIIIIAHSMGGLIARRYIIDKIKNDKELGKLKGLITYATPHQGSILANYFSFVVKNPLPNFLNPFRLFASKQIYSLAKNSPFLETLDKEWSTYKIDDRIDFKRVVGADDSVVDISSSTYVDNEKVSFVTNKGHLNIIKPSKIITDAAFMVTYNYLKNFRSILEKKIEFEKEYDEYFEDEV
jgi:triacylglycerol esterase/lipase EstA (alpha/beta hydrolase family)